MYPYILPGDICVFRPDHEGPRIGQLGLIVNDKGILYSHRLRRIERVGSGIKYVFRGDANGYDDIAVYHSQIIGVLSELKRGGTTISEASRVRRCWSFVAVRATFAFIPFALIARRKERQIESQTSGRWETHGVGGTGGTIDP
jgi:hypothetical protein